MSTAYRCAVLVVLAAMLVAVSGDTGYAPRPHIPILKDDRSSNAYGEYTYEYKTGNDISRSGAGKQNDGQISSGGWSYISPEGLPVQIKYVADQGGYQPAGDVIPVAPPLPYSRTGN